MNTNDVSLIIPNRDGREYLGTCLDAIAGQTVKPMETIVVDDASNDDSVALIRDKYPWVRVISSSEKPIPQGFAGSVNAGIRAAKGAYIALLNNDTRAEPGWLEEMLKTLSASPKAASCACKMMQKEEAYINAVGLMMHRGGTCGTIGDGEPDGEKFNITTEVFGPSGGAALWKKEVLDEIGLFDEDFFAYYEDADLSYRARAAGYTSVYTPASRVVHLEGRCPSLKRFDKVKLRIRNGIWFAWCNLPRSTISGMTGTILWNTFFRYLMKYGMRPWKVEGRSFWKAFVSIILHPAQMLSKRMERQKGIRVATEELEKWIGRNPFG